MGKPNEGSNPNSNNDEVEEGVQEPSECTRCCNACASGICTLVVLKWVVALLLSLNLLAFGVWSLPFFGKGNSRADGRPAHGKNVQAQIQASFRLQKSKSALNANIPKLESAIWDEVGIPYTKVAVVSLEPLNSTNSTEVIFDVLPDPEKTSISPYGLFTLRETFLSLLASNYNLTLKLEAFGNAYFFQLLKFPGGITVEPKQSVFALQRSPLFFNFTLHNTIAQVVQNLAQLRIQLSIGLRVHPNENVLVHLTNLQGSTVSPPIIVETYIVPVVGKDQISTPRIRQLAHEINPARNLGLNHTLFGKVKQIQLSSYLRYPSSPPPYHVSSPAPSPSHHISNSHISPSPSYPFTPSTHAKPPSIGQHVLAPSPYHRVLAPISRHHGASHPHHHHAMPPSYHHFVAPSPYHSHIHCYRQHASDPIKCRHQHVGHPPISGFNGETPSPSPDISRHFRYHHHRKATYPPHVVTSVPPPKALPWYSHFPPVPLASPPSSGFPFRSQRHFAPKSAPPPPSNTMASSPKSVSLAPEGLSHSPPPERSMTSHPDRPNMVSPASALSYVSSSSFGPNPVELIIRSFILMGTVLSMLT